MPFAQRLGGPQSWPGRFIGADNGARASGRESKFSSPALTFVSDVNLTKQQSHYGSVPHQLCQQRTCVFMQLRDFSSHF